MESVKTKVLRINGSKTKESFEITIDRSEFESVRHFLKHITKTTSLKAPSRSAKLYTKEGLEIFDEDVMHMLSEDVFFYAPQGKYSLITII